MRVEGIERLDSTQINYNQKDFLVMFFLIKDLKNAIDQYAKGTVLDIGCGNKPYESFFKNKIKLYTGCDVVQSSDKKVDVICEATSLNLDNESFDTVFSTQVIEHIDDPFKMLSEAYRVLKPNGSIIISAPFAWELHEEPYDFYRYSKYGLKKMLEKAGFSQISVKANGGKWAAIMQLQINIIYSTFKSKNFCSKFLKLLFIHLHFTSLFNRLALWLDKKYPDELLTLNYVVTAIKQ